MSSIGWNARIRALALAALCAVPLVLALDVMTIPPPPADDARAPDLGIGELEMGRDFGRPTAAPERGVLATILFGLVLALCPAKFVLLWALQRRESRHVRFRGAAARR